MFFVIATVGTDVDQWHQLFSELVVGIGCQEWWSKSVVVRIGEQRCVSVGDGIGWCWLVSELVVGLLVVDQWVSVVVGIGCLNRLSESGTDVCLSVMASVRVSDGWFNRCLLLRADVGMLLSESGFVGIGCRNSSYGFSRNCLSEFVVVGVVVGVGLYKCRSLSLSQ